MAAAAAGASARTVPVIQVRATIATLAGFISFIDRYLAFACDGGSEHLTAADIAHSDPFAFDSIRLRNRPGGEREVATCVDEGDFLAACDCRLSFQQVGANQLAGLQEVSDALAR